MSAQAKGSTRSVKSMPTAHLGSWATGALLSLKIFVLQNYLDSSHSIPTSVSLLAIKMKKIKNFRVGKRKEKKEEKKKGLCLYIQILSGEWKRSYLEPQLYSLHADKP